MTKRFALLRLKHGANQVVVDVYAPDLKSAVEKLSKHITGVTLDEDGYGKLDDVTFCVAEFFNPFYTV